MTASLTDLLMRMEEDGCPGCAEELAIAVEAGNHAKARRIALESARHMVVGEGAYEDGQARSTAAALTEWAEALTESVAVEQKAAERDLSAAWKAVNGARAALCEAVRLHDAAVQRCEAAGITLSEEDRYHDTPIPRG